MPADFRFTVDTTRGLELAASYKRQAQKAELAILRANKELAQQVQKAEADELIRQVRTGGGRGARPQRHALGSSPLVAALKDDRNRHVESRGFTVNDEEFLDRSVVYWRQLEDGAGGHFQILSGLFLLQSGKRGGGGAFPRSGSTAGPGHQGGVARSKGRAAGSIFERPISGRRTAVKFAQFHGGGARTFEARVGPLNPYEYIQTGTKNVREQWASTNKALNVYRRAFEAEGLNLMAQFRTTHGGRASFGDLSE